MKTDGSEREVVRELFHEKRQRESSERTARDLSGISVERICGKTVERISWKTEGEHLEK
jgi:hypothetical protein